MKKTASTVLAIVCGICFLLNLCFFVFTGGALAFFGAFICLVGTILNAANALREAGWFDEAAATVVLSLPKQQPICQFCGKHQVSGLENCPNCGAAYNE